MQIVGLQLWRAFWLALLAACRVCCNPRAQADFSQRDLLPPVALTKSFRHLERQIARDSQRRRIL